jgi:hypothetical protein
MYNSDMHAEMNIFIKFYLTFNNRVNFSLPYQK